MNAKAKSHLKLLAMMLGVCAVFTAGRLAAEKFWGITYNARTIEILIGVFVLLHLGLPVLLKKLKKGKPTSPHMGQALPEERSEAR